MLLPPIKVSPPRPKKFLLKFSGPLKQHIRKHPALMNNQEKYFVISPFIPNKLVACRSTRKNFKSPFRVVDVYSKEKSESTERVSRFFESMTPKMMNIVSPISLNNRLKRGKLQSLSPACHSKGEISLLNSLQKRRLVPRHTPDLYRPSSTKSSSDSNHEIDLLRLYPNYFH